MTQKKKLQVFISSTFEDLKEERQAAVEAVLSAGHIPAGMELFAAGDESQMNVIKRWIDESDVFLLILGGRYGSIEPLSQKSYIHLEYEYAVEREKPLFAVVISETHIEERVIEFRTTKLMETENPQKLKDFRSLVLTKMSRFWSNLLEIKLAIHESMSDFSRRDELVGWISGSEAVNSGALAEELARLTKENSELRERLSKSTISSSGIYNGLTYEQMRALLKKSPFETSSFSGEELRTLNEAVKAFGGTSPNALHVLWVLRKALQVGEHINNNEREKVKVMRALIELGIITAKDNGSGGAYYQLTPMSKDFLLRLQLDSEADAAQNYYFERF